MTFKKLNEILKQVQHKKDYNEKHKTPVTLKPAGRRPNYSIIN